MFLNAIFFFFIRFGINMEKKSILLCKWEKQILTLEGRGGIFLYKLQEFIEWKKALPPHLVSQILYTALTSNERWVWNFIMMIKDERWVYRDACYHPFPFLSDVACTKPFFHPEQLIVHSLQKKTHLYSRRVCWHVSIGTLVTNCTTSRSSVPLKSR